MMDNAGLLKGLLVFTRDGEWGRGEPADSLTEMAVIRGTDFEAVRYGDLLGLPIRYIRNHIAAYKTLEPEDILIETAGGSTGRPMGRTVFLKPRIFNDTKLPLTCASFSRFLRVDKSVADPEYIYWYLQYLYAVGIMTNYQVQHTGVARFQYTTFAESIEIPLPPLPEQRAIAHILGSLDDKIDLNRRMNATLEAIARAIFKSWFVDFDPVYAKMRGERPYGMDDATAALFPDDLVESELGLIPRGWEVSSLGDLFPKDKECVLTGPFGSKLHAHDYREVGVPLILVKHVNNGHISEEDLPLVGEHKWDELERYRLAIGDIVFTRVGAVGRSAYIYPRFENWFFSGQTLRVRVPDDLLVNSRYLAQIYLEPSFTHMVESFALGTTRPSLSTKILRSFRFLLPPVEIQNAFVDLINPLDERVQNNIDESRTLAETRDALLPRLVSGQLRVGEV